MFPNVRLLIAAVVASIVALSCGFAIFAAYRVNHEPLSRLATGAAPLQLAAGNPMPSATMPAAVESFGIRFQLNQAEIAGAAAAAPPPQADQENNAAPPSAVASTAEAETGAAEPERPALEQPAPVAQVPAIEPEAKQSEATPSEAPAVTGTAAVAPPAEQALPAAQAAPTEQASQETKSVPTPAAAPLAPEIHHKPAPRHRLAAKPPRARQARALQPGSQPSGIGGPFVPPPNR